MSIPIYTSKTVKAIFAQYLTKIDTDSNFPTNKYGTDLCISKGDTLTLERYHKAVEEEVAAYIKANNLKKVPTDYNNPLKDGDVLYAKDAEKVEEGEKDEDWLKKQLYKKGNYFLRVASKNKPQIVDTNKQEMTDVSLYNVEGQWALNVSYYKVSTDNQGITVYLGGAMVHKNGAAVDVTAGFDEVEDDEAFA